jgi:hypothetical protein
MIIQISDLESRLFTLPSAPRPHSGPPLTGRAAAIAQLTPLDPQRKWVVPQFEFLQMWMADARLSLVATDPTAKYSASAFASTATPSCVAFEHNEETYLTVSLD